MAQEQETENDVGELENRLERLRVLYEQYFMGLEKREPAIPHKDVERRIQQLRKVRFQSTAARFKFQTMVQRFNTLQQYWTRTCREIENGTYKRHLQRAARRLATVPPPDVPQHEGLGDAKAREKSRAATADDLAALLSEDVDLEAEMAGALAALEKSPEAPKKTLSALGQSKDGPRAHTSPTLHLGKASPLKTLTPEAKPSINPRLSTSPKPAELAPLVKRPTTASALVGLGKATPTAAPTAEKKAETPTQAAPAPAAPVPAAPAPAAPVPAPPIQTKAVPAPAAAPARPAPARAPAPLPALARPAPARAPAPLPAVARPVPPAAPAAAKPAPPAPQNDARLSAERIKTLHDNYVEARKKTNASPVSYEKLEKNIRETEQKLRAQHQGRNIDFEVDIKDGKAILKPRLK